MTEPGLEPGSKKLTLSPWCSIASWVGDGSSLVLVGSGDGGKDLLDHKLPALGRASRVTPRGWHRKLSKGGGTRGPYSLIPAQDSHQPRLYLAPTVPFLSHVPSPRKEAHPTQSTLFPVLPILLCKGRSGGEVPGGILACVRGRSNGAPMVNPLLMPAATS